MCYANILRNSTIFMQLSGANLSYLAMYLKKMLQNQTATFQLVILHVNSLTKVWNIIFSASYFQYE